MTDALDRLAETTHALRRVAANYRSAEDESRGPAMTPTGAARATS
ncbi:hypothetical protein [Dactylosporangium sp. CA-139066]